MKIYNTNTRNLEDFVPITPNEVKIYTCGMTVYDNCHLGHARSMVVFDAITRWFRTSGYKVTFVRNITDIDDKIIKRAVENNETIYSLTNRMIKSMEQDAEYLNTIPPTYQPRATDFIREMQTVIGKLVDKNLAYQTQSGDVNFSVRSYPNYGSLSGKSIDELLSGSRVEVNDDKRDPLDFVLWKASKPTDPKEARWESKWGRGRPGWHIECSAMSCALLGETFDIHGGGADLQFPHHENEVAQSEGANDAPLANYWIHNAFVVVSAQRMGKSMGNALNIKELQKYYNGEVVRLFILRKHYRSPQNYSEEHLVDAKAVLKRLYTALLNFKPDESFVIDWSNPHAEKFKQFMDKDFDTGNAVTLLIELATELRKKYNDKLANLLVALGNTIGLLYQDPVTFMQTHTPIEITSEEIVCLLAIRADLRSQKKWKTADDVRLQLEHYGVILKDSPSGTVWYVM